MTAPYPFSAVVGADDLKLALLLNAVHPAIGGVLVRGEKGTAKSTAVRGLAALLPDVAVVAGCAFACDPTAPDPQCPAGPHPAAEYDGPGGGAQIQPVRLVELPVGASEDRLAGSLDLERALVEGQRAFEPGLLAQAHRGVLYVDEVNLLGDHLVDLLLDAAAMGVNIVEREGVSVRHASRFQLIGTMNPEEGELRPQLLDRFGLTVEVAASHDVGERAEVVRRRLAYEADPEGFAARYVDADAEVAASVRAARRALPGVELGEQALGAVVAACAAFEVDGMRADIVTAKAATALAAWDGRTAVTIEDVRRAALLALPHRRRRGPFDPPGIDEQALDDALSGLDEDGPDDEPPGGSGPDAGGGGERGQAGAPPPAADRPPSDDPTRAAGPGDETAQGAPDDAPDDPDDGSRRQQPEQAASEDAAPGPDAEDGSGDGARTRPAGTQVQGVGATFDPVLLQVRGNGAGALGRRSPARTPRGRHTGDRRPHGRVADVALGATLRTAAPRQAARGRSGAGLVLARDDLREKVRTGREGNLVLFVVDASGSMAARRRMTQVKGAVLSLLTDAYQRRDRIGLVTFRGEDAHLALPPTSSVDVAARLLAELPTGGRTPLSVGLARAAEVLASARVRDPERRPLLVLLTDGRATSGGGVQAAEAAARGLGLQGVPAVVVDTEDAAVRLGLAGRIAAHMGAPVLRLEQLGSLAGAVRGITVGGAATSRRATSQSTPRSSTPRRAA